MGRNDFHVGKCLESYDRGFTSLSLFVTNALEGSVEHLVSQKFLRLISTDMLSF